MSQRKDTTMPMPIASVTSTSNTTGASVVITPGRCPKASCGGSVQTEPLMEHHAQVGWVSHCIHCGLIVSATYFPEIDRELSERDARIESERISYEEQEHEEWLKWYNRENGIVTRGVE